MAKQIEVSDATYEKLLEMMTPEDTAASVIARLLNPQPNSTTTLRDIKDDDLNFHLNAVPDLTFSKIISVKVDGRIINANKWVLLRNAVVRIGIERGLDMKDILSLHSVNGAKSDEGFEFHPDLGISIQGQSAKDSWKTCSDICSLISVNLEVFIQWRDNEKAAYPGQKARLLIP